MNIMQKKIKNYSKNPTKLIQIRVSEKEYEEIVDFFKGIDKTRRMWIVGEIKKKRHYY